MSRALPAPGLREKLAGSADYARDLLDRSGCAVAGFVRSPHAHARILEIDTTAALAVPGVLGVLTGVDFAGIRLGSEIPDEAVLAEDEVTYVGDHVAGVCAEDEESLRRGLRAVQVAYELLPAVPTPEVALATQDEAVRFGHSGNLADEASASRGDWDQVAAEVTHWAEGEFEIRPVQHAYMEPYCALALWEEGLITLYTPTHSPAKVREEYRPWMERIEERFEIRTPAFGGAFGAKYEHPLHLVCAEFARRFHRDVGMVLSRREDFLAARPRVPMKLRVRVGADSSGRLIAKEADVVADNGAASLHGPSVFRAAMMRMDNLYRYRAIRDRGRLLYTNTPPTECYRGFGDPEAAFAQEQLVDELARRLGLDAVEVRRMNAVGDADTTVHGWHITSSGFDQCLDFVARKLEQDRSAGIQGIGRFRVGLGMSPGMHVTSNRGRVSRDFAAIRLSVGAEGRVLLHSSEIDCGTGAGRVLARLVARAMEIDPSLVVPVLGDTEAGPDGMGSYASRTTFFAGNAAIRAGHALKDRAESLRAQLRAGSLAELVARLTAAGRSDELTLVEEYVSEGTERPDDSEYGNRSPAYTFCVHGCRVRVDTWTGTVKVERYWAAHDSGTILDQPGACGQVIGGVLQGIGHALSEESLLAGTGEVVNPGFLDYRIPTSLDSVPIEVFFADVHDPGGPMGAKSLAEPPIIPVAACIANAVHDATGVRLHVLPMTPERVLGAIAAAG